MIESVSVWKSSGSSGLGSNWFGQGFYFSPLHRPESLGASYNDVIRNAVDVALSSRSLGAERFLTQPIWFPPKSKVQSVPFACLSLLTGHRKNSRCNSYVGDQIQFCCRCKFPQISLLPQKHWCKLCPLGFLFHVSSVQKKRAIAHSYSLVCQRCVVKTKRSKAKAFLNFNIRFMSFLRTRRLVSFAEQPGTLKI